MSIDSRKDHEGYFFKWENGLIYLDVKRGHHKKGGCENLSALDIRPDKLCFATNADVPCFDRKEQNFEHLDFAVGRPQTMSWTLALPRFYLVWNMGRSIEQTLTIEKSEQANLDAGKKLSQNKHLSFSHPIFPSRPFIFLSAFLHLGPIPNERI